MKFIGVIALAALPFTAFAGSVSVEKNQNVARSADEIVSVLTDYENTCDQGCTYFVKGLKETKVIEISDDLYSGSGLNPLVTPNNLSLTQLCEMKMELLWFHLPIPLLKKLVN